MGITVKRVHRIAKEKVAGSNPVFRSQWDKPGHVPGLLLPCSRVAWKPGLLSRPGPDRDRQLVPLKALLGGVHIVSGVFPGELVDEFERAVKREIDDVPA